MPLRGVLVALVLLCLPVAQAQETTVQYSYDGNYENSRFHGEAALTTPELQFRGSFAYGRPLHGTLVLASGGILEVERIETLHDSLTLHGALVNVKSGIRTDGSFRMRNETVTAGVIPAGEVAAFGVVVRHFPDGSRFQGRFSGDLPDGKGLRTLASGLDYHELWQNGEKISQWPGPASLTQRVKDQPCSLAVPRDDWAWFGFSCRNGKVSGEGVAYSPDGSEVFNGTVADGQWQTGQYETADGRLLDGQWRAFSLSGPGTEMKDGQVVYQGEWARGRKHGEGVCARDEQFEPCRFFRGKRLKDQEQLVASENRQSESLQADIARYQSRTLASFNRQRQQRSEAWQNRARVIRENEASRQHQVAVNRGVMQHMYGTFDNAAREMQQISNQTNEVIREAYAQNEAQNRQKKAAWEADMARREAEAAARAEEARQRREAALAASRAQSEKEKEELAAERRRQQAECEANDGEWMVPGYYCKKDFHLVLGYSCFDDQRRPRPCTKEEAAVKQKEAMERASKQEWRRGPNGIIATWGGRPGPDDYGTALEKNPESGPVGASGSTSSADNKAGTSEASGNSGSASGSGEGGKPRPREKAFAIHVEAIAYCDENRDGEAWCHGPLQKLRPRVSDMEKALSGVGCDNPEPARRVPFHHASRTHPGWIYYCGYGMDVYDKDIAAEYDVPGTIRQRRNSYKCEKNRATSCTTLHQHQDGLRPNYEVVTEIVPSAD